LLHPPHLFVNPFSIWSDFALKSGEAMLEAAQTAVARPAVPRPTSPRVAVIHEERPAPKAKAKGKKRLAKR